MMVSNLRGIVLATLALACFLPAPVSTAQAQEPTISAAPGSLVRWTVPGATNCT